VGDEDQCLCRDTKEAMMREIFESYGRYNAWMNERVYAGCAKLPDSRRKQDMGAFFKSIHGTLSHILIGDQMWMARFTCKPLPALTLDAIVHEDFDELWAVRRVFDEEIKSFVATLQEDWLAQPFTFTSIAYGRTFTYPTWFLVMQMFNHQTHHRGQVTTLMKQCGIDPGPTDWPAMPAEG
jgi:uncharacterized damage-inducible protein DinB